ncbi:hypothetical protein FQN54_001193 [Arachnomyces sp. PD_36]|nr:hypothetical protein FQN54_001193 [Arachnomyces sp. PD_36]
MVDAAYYREDIDQTYFFGGTRYARIQFTPSSPDEKITVGPTKIARNWPGLANVGFTTVDAVLPHPTAAGEAYFFFGGRYVRYKVPDDRIIYGPHPIFETWKCLEKAGFDTVDAAFAVPGVANEAYVFRGTKYVRIHVLNDSVVFGPVNITGNWPGLTQAGFDSVDTALAVQKRDDGETYFFKGDQYVKMKVVAGAPDTIVWGPKPIEEAWKTLEWV